MERDERIAISVTDDEKSDFRVMAAERDMYMSELLYHMLQVYFEDEEMQEKVDQHIEDQEASTEGNPIPAATATVAK